MCVPLLWRIARRLPLNLHFGWALAQPLPRSRWLQTTAVQRTGLSGYVSRICRFRLPRRPKAQAPRGTVA